MSEFQQEDEGGVTPGAVRSIAYWKNMSGEPVTRAQAEAVEIHEFDKDGNIIQTTYAYLGDRQAAAKKKRHLNRALCQRQTRSMCLTTPDALNY